MSAASAPPTTVRLQTALTELRDLAPELLSIPPADAEARRLARQQMELIVREARAMERHLTAAAASADTAPDRASLASAGA